MHAACCIHDRRQSSCRKRRSRVRRVFQLSSARSFVFIAVESQVVSQNSKLHLFSVLRARLCTTAGRVPRKTQTRAAGSRVGPMLHPAGPSQLYPEANRRVEEILAGIDADEEKRIMEGIAAGTASGYPDIEGIEAVQEAIEAIEAIEAVIESPPEWGRPDEGNPNQPRRPPEYQPPQVHILYAACKSTWQFCTNKCHSRSLEASVVACLPKLKISHLHEHMGLPLMCSCCMLKGLQMGCTC